MLKVSSLLRSLRGAHPSAEEGVLRALDAFLDPAADTLELTRRLVGSLRPKGRHDASFVSRHALMLQRLEDDATLRVAFRSHLVHFIATRRLVTFFTDSGVLPGTGFFSEWWRILWNRLLPEVPDERRLKDCLPVIYERNDDWRWLEQIPAEQSQRFWALLAPAEELRNEDWRAIQEQMLDAVLLLAHRISGLGVDNELMRAAPNFDDNTPSFVALSAEALDFVTGFRGAMVAGEQPEDDGSHLRVIAGQCRAALAQIRKRAQTIGTSLHLSYLLTRGEQSLDRLDELATMLTASQAATSRAEAIEAWAAFSRDAFLAENRRNSLRHYVGQLSRLLAVRVTENAARAGEHYICEDAAAYRWMWRSAAGAGVLIGTMALLKVFAAGLHAPLLVEAFLFSLIYGGGFVLIYLLGLTIATKQPAMTAQTLAGLLGDLKPNRAADVERLVDVVAAVSRSQLAAIGGNVLVALPVSILIAVGLGALSGVPVIPMEKAAHLLADLDPLSWALPHAAIAGFYLFLSGLLSGYFDNKAAYIEVGARLARLRWLRKLLGSERAARFGQYIQEHLGGIMGNFLFGCMLGSTGVLGTLLGLPLDIRHIAFASANLGYALTGFQFALAWQALLWGAFGIALIGLTNLTVSFALALRTALGARRIRFGHWGTLLAALARRFRQQPGSFLLPPRAPSGQA